MSEDLKLSVITYTLNAASTVARTIESIVSQDYPKVELVVIDGASIDGTVETIRAFGNRINYFVSESDAGGWDAANKGIQAASGEIVCFAMADDWFEPGALTEIAGAFSDPRIAVVSSGVRVVREVSPQQYELVVQRSGTQNALDLANILDVPYMGARYFRRELLLKEGGFSADFPISHDRELMLRLYCAGVKTGTIERPLYVYRQHQGSRTLVFRPDVALRILDEHLRIAQRYLADSRLSRTDRQALLDWVCEQHARALILEGRGHDWRKLIDRIIAAGCWKPGFSWSLVRRLAYRSLHRRRHARAEG